MKSRFENFIIWFTYIMVWVVVLGSIVMSIYCFVKFGNMPIQEVPSWALWFMFGGRK